MSMTLVDTKSALREALHLPTIQSERKLHRHAAETGEKMREIEGAFEEVLPMWKHRSQSLPSVQDYDDYFTNVDTWCAKLEASLMENGQVGKVKMLEDTAICTFYENHRKNGWLDNKLWTVRHSHKVFRPKLLRLPCAVKIPEKGQAIIDRLSKAGLERSIRILTGELIGEHQNISKEWTERAALGRAVDSVRSNASATMAFVQRNARALGAGLVGGGAALAASFAAISAGDPAIIIGDTCFWGWIEK